MGPGSESHGEERSLAKVSWAELTSAGFRWSCVSIFFKANSAFCQFYNLGNVFLTSLGAISEM